MTKTRKKGHFYEFPRPSLTVDAVLITRERQPRVLLIERKHEPFAGCWALPGGFVNEEENPDAAVLRELKEETGIQGVKVEQLQAFGKAKRDPRGWTLTIAYLGRVKKKQMNAVAADDAAEAAWHPLHRLPPLAFDHAEILALARKRLGKR